MPLSTSTDTRPTPSVPDARSAAVELLTVREVATAMQVSKMTVYRLIHAGTLDAVRVGQSLRLSRGSVEAFLRTGGDAQNG